MRRIAIAGITITGLVLASTATAIPAYAVGSHAQPAAISAAEQVATLLNTQSVDTPTPSGSTDDVTQVQLRADTPATQEQSVLSLTADVRTDGTSAPEGTSVAVQRSTPSPDGLGTDWITVAVLTTDTDGRATAEVMAGAQGVESYRAVSPAPTADSVDGVVAAGTSVSPQLDVAVTSQSVPIAQAVRASWPSRGSLGSNEHLTVPVRVTTTGGAPAAGVSVGFEYSADNGVTWTATGLPLRDLTDPLGFPSLVPGVAAAPITNAQGEVASTLIAPTAPGSVLFRAVAGVNALPSTPSPTYGVVIDSDSLYNPPGNGTSGVEQINTMPSQPGVLIKAQKLESGGATVVDRPLQYPAVPANNPLVPGQPLVVPIVEGAGAPACFYRQDTREACVVGSTDGAGKPLTQDKWADQYRILYSDKRFLLNPPPLTDEASIGGDLGTLEAASALVFVPKNANADSKVVAWTHPTIGQEPHCSVTRGFDTIPTVPGIDLTPMNGGAQINAGDMSFFLEQVLAAGHIVVMPDYMGIGVNGPTGEKKSYMIGQQEARDVYYGVKALQTAAAPGWSGINGSPWTGSDFVVIGHSQGGHAAMWTAIEGAKPWAQATGLSLKGVVAAAPATDLNKIVEGQWQGYPGWVLAPELIQTYAFQSPAFAAFALNNNVLSPDGIANLDAFTTYCTTQAFAASVGLVNAGKNFLLNPAEHPQQFLNWAPVFAQQTPISTPGMVNSFPQDMPFQLISGTADNIVVSQINAAMQQSFCQVDEAGVPTVPMRAYWLPSMTGLNTNPVSTFAGTISDSTLSVSKLIGGRGSQYTKQAYGTPLPSGTDIPLNNVNTMRVGDRLIGWGADAANPTPAPAGTTVTAIDYNALTVTLSNSVTPDNAALYFQPVVPGPLGVGTVLTWAANVAAPGDPSDIQPQTATITASISGGGGAGDYQLDSTPVFPTPLAGTNFQVQASVTPPGGASPVSNLQVPDHLNPLTFPFTQTSAGIEDNVVAYSVANNGLTSRTVTIRLADPLPQEFVVGASFVLSGMPKLTGTTTGKPTADVNGTRKITALNAAAQTVSFNVGPSNLPKATTSEQTLSDPAHATTLPTYNNSASELLNFTEDVFAGTPVEANCHEVDEAHPTGLSDTATGTTWYNFPSFGLLDLINLAALPGKESFYKSWGSPALPEPTETNPQPSLGLLFTNTQQLTVVQSGCAFPWQPPLNFDARPTNPACNQYGLWPYGQFSYTSHDVDTGLWGVYPNEGQNPTIPAGGTPAPTPTGSVFTDIEPVRVYDSRLLGAGGPISAGEPRTIDLTAAGNLQLPPGTTAVAYNITATGQTASGYATVTPGNVVTEPVTSTLNWSAAQQTRANGYTVGIDANNQIKVFVGGTGSSEIIIDVLGYYADGNDGTLFVPISPQRVYATQEPIFGGESLVVDVVTGAPGAIPANVAAIAYNLTITGTTRTGFLSVAPASAVSAPSTSTINWSAPNTTIANATQGAVSNGRVSVYATGTGSTQFFLDVVGYYVAPGDVPPGAVGTRFVPIDPARAYDSRVDVPVGPLAGNPQTGGVGQPRTTNVGRFTDVPAGAKGVAFNLTITGNAGSGFLTTAPAGQSAPQTSDINWTSGNTTLANGSLSGVSDARELTTWAAGRYSTQYLVDIAGYFK